MILELLAIYSHFQRFSVGGGVLIDKTTAINKNSKTVFTDYEILKLVFHSSQLLSVFCQSLCVVILSIFISVRG